MRKLLIIPVMIIFVLSVTACGSTGITNGNTNTITEAQLTDKEKILLSIGSSKYFVFDFKVDSKYKWAKVWVDKYEHGKKAEESGTLMADLSEGEEGMIIAAVRGNGARINDWVLAVNSGGALSKAESKNVYEVEEDSAYASVMSSNKSKIDIKDKELVLASACYTVSQEGESSLSSFSNGFYDDPEAHMEEIAEYDIVYLLKCRFYNTEKQP
ncbi:MAG TPA: hypothetical protein VEG39_21235 [Clostridia bacterium]|nr:hypothetical protein [Clostridia bacterium]